MPNPNIKTLVLSMISRLEPLCEDAETLAILNESVGFAVGDNLEKALEALRDAASEHGWE